MPTACPEITTYYHVIITSPLGCTYEDSVLIIVNPEPLLIFPSAFSPNEDGKNDVFRPVILGLATLDEFRIFDRWGVMIFEVTGLQVVISGHAVGIESFGLSSPSAGIHW